MFACFRNAVSNYEPKYEIICNLNGYITEVSNDACSELLYEKEMLVGQFIGIIMSPFMSYLHSAILLPKYKNASKFQRNLMHIVLNGKTTKRPLLIYNCVEQPIFVNLSVSVFNDLGGNTFFKLLFTTVCDFKNMSVYLTTYLSPKLFTRFRQTTNSIIFANIEFSYSEPNDEMKQIEIHQNFIDDVIGLIKHSFYPYLYIYETSNNGCVIVSNLCCTYNMPRYCASLIVCFLRNLHFTTAKYVSMKIGVSYDKARIGVLADGQIRIFGNVYDNAIVLRNSCNTGDICCSRDFAHKFTLENMYPNTALYSRMGDVSNTKFVDITKIENDILHEHSHEFQMFRSAEPTKN